MWMDFTVYVLCCICFLQLVQLVQYILTHIYTLSHNLTDYQTLADQAKEVSYK